MTTENELLAEMRAALPEPYDPDVDVTADDVAAMMGTGKGAAVSKLRAMEAAGILESRFTYRGDGYRVRVWRKVRCE